MFNETQDISISGDVANVVHRDQYNGATTIINRIVRVGRPGRSIVKRERKRHDIDSGYNQYREIIRGDIHKLEQICEDNRNWEWEDGQFVETSYRRTEREFMATTEYLRQSHFMGKMPKRFAIALFPLSDCLLIVFAGLEEGVHEIDPAALLQLFAINRSKVPTLLFYDEWLPLGHLDSKMEGRFWEGYYLRVYILAWQERLLPNSSESRLWLNSQTGHVSSGPIGPLAGRALTSVLYNCEDMPSAIEMATMDTCLRFFNETGAGNLDYDVLEYAHEQSSFTCIESLLGIDSPDDHTHIFWKKSTRRGLWYCHFCDHIACDEVQDFIGKLRLETVYSGAQLEKIAIVKEGFAYTWTASPGGLSNHTLIDNGLTRFQFNVGIQHLGSTYFDTSILAKAWLSHAHRSDLFTSGSETYFRPHLEVFLHLEPRRKQFGVSDLKTLPIVYLFLRPPPLYLADIDSWLSHVSFWSFDKNGTSEIPETECERLGLPYITLQVYFSLRAWPKHVYDGLHVWQVTRGFDPTTADFARSLGLPILEPAITQFESVAEEEEPSPTPDHSPSQDSASDETAAEKEETAFSQISSWFSWTATPQSDFSAFAI
uniref:Uncharacterized protein n=1 Tax=Moniliophthora roreri TaxID=221103 RepID=A0A0W0FI54_MONRR